MPHRDNQRLAGVPPRATLPVVLPKNGMERRLDDILDELKLMRGEENFNPRASLTEIHDHFVGKIDISTALTKSRIAIPITKVLTFLDLPIALTTFEVRLRSPDGPPINLIRAGNQIRLANATDKIFVTTAPAIANGTIPFIAGQAEVVHTDRVGFTSLTPEAALLDDTGGAQIDLITGGPDVKTQYAHTGTLAADGVVTPFINIPKNLRMQLRFMGYCRLASVAATLQHVDVNAVAADGGALEQKLYSWQINEAGDPQVDYTTPVFYAAKDLSIKYDDSNFLVNNDYRFSSLLTVWPR